MTKEAAEVRPLHILIPVDLHDRLKAMAKARDRSVAAETRRAVEERLKDFDRDDSKAEAAA